MAQIITANQQSTATKYHGFLQPVCVSLKQQQQQQQILLKIGK